MTFDDASSNRAIRVLNAFPAKGSELHSVIESEFVYSNGVTARLEKSSALKVWMEGGKIDGLELREYIFSYCVARYDK